MKSVWWETWLMIYEIGSLINENFDAGDLGMHGVWVYPGKMKLGSFNWIWLSEVTVKWSY